MGLLSSFGRKAARRAVHKELSGEMLMAEGTASFLLTDGVTTVWPQVYIAVTEERIAWALVKRADAPVMSMRFHQVVRHGDEGARVELTERDPGYAAMLSDPSNPHGETDAVFTFDASPESAGIRNAISTRVRSS